MEPFVVVPAVALLIVSLILMASMISIGSWLLLFLPAAGIVLSMVVLIDEWRDR